MKDEKNEFCLIFTNLGRCLLYLPLNYEDDEYATECALNVPKTCTLICSIQQLGNNKCSTSMTIQNFSVVVEHEEDIIIALFKSKNSNTKVGHLKMKRVLDHFLNMYERPLRDLKALEKQLIEQETKNFVFKIKEKEVVEISVVNKYIIFKGYGSTIKEFLYNDLVEENIIQALLNSEQSIERVLIFDEYLNPLYNKSRKRSRHFNLSSPEGKYLELALKASVDFAIDGKSKHNVFTYLLINKLCIVTVLETRNDILFFIFITSALKLADVVTEKTNNGCVFVQNTKDYLPSAFKKIEGFYERIIQWYSVPQSQKDQCERDWVKTNLSFSQKNGRKFFKNKHTSTVITPADDDPSKYITPRPPPQVGVSNITNDVNNASFTSSTDEESEYYDEEEEGELGGEAEPENVEKPQPSPPKLPPQEIRFVRTYKMTE